jgi:sugar lactone lactonase YvrE
MPRFLILFALLGALLVPGFSSVNAADKSARVPQPPLIDLKTLPQATNVGNLEVVALFRGAMPTGVTVSHDGRIFVNFPRWGDKVDYTVAELTPKEVPYPSAEMNKPEEDNASQRLISVQSVVVDPKNRLWLLDTGRISWGAPVPGGPKLVGVDLATNKVFKTIQFPEEIVLPTTYLNDVRFDLTRGEEGMAFITDSSGERPGLIAVDLASGRSWRRLTGHPSTMPLTDFVSCVEGRPWMLRSEGEKPRPVRVGADGIALSSDGKRIFYCPLSSWSLYSVSADALADESLTDEQVAETVKYEGEKVASDGLESDAENRLYVTGYDQGAILRKSPDDTYETLAFHPTILWPDTLCLAEDGFLYFTVNQLHRQPQFHAGKDLREKPYVLYRIKVDAKPVLLK